MQANPRNLDALDLSAKETKSHYRQCQKCWWKSYSDSLGLLTRHPQAGNAKPTA